LFESLVEASNDLLALLTLSGGCVVAEDTVGDDVGDEICRHLRVVANGDVSM
jgi:hypothetical protein